MATLTLSQGAIPAICAAVDGGNDLKPVLQVTDIRLTKIQSTRNSTERYRLLLSDGVHCHQCAIVPQINDLIKNGGLQTGSIIRLLHFICNTIAKRTVIIVVELEVLQATCPLIGEPKQYFPPGALVTPSVGQAKVNHVHVQHGNSQATGPDPTYLASEAGRLQQSKLESGAQLQSYGNNVGSGTYGVLNNVKTNILRALSSVYTLLQQPMYQQQPPMYTNWGHVVKNEADANADELDALAALDELVVGPSKEPELLLSQSPTATLLGSRQSGLVLGVASSSQNTKPKTPFQISPKPGPTNREKDLAVRCFKCQGFGHFQSACPNKRTVTLREAICLRNELYNEACDEEGLFLANREEAERDEIVAYEAQSHEKRRLLTQPEPVTAEQWDQNFHTECQWSDRCRILINLISNFKSCERGLEAPPRIVPAADLMATVTLSKGSIAALCSGSGNSESDMKPVVQVADIKLVRYENASRSTDRYRLVLSDGVHMQQGMLATQLNDLVRNGHLQKGSLVQLLQFICNKIQSRMLVSFS